MENLNGRLEDPSEIHLRKVYMLYDRDDNGEPRSRPIIIIRPPLSKGKSKNRDFDYIVWDEHLKLNGKAKVHRMRCEDVGLTLTQDLREADSFLAPCPIVHPFSLDEIRGYINRGSS